MQVTLTKVYLDQEKMSKNGKPYRKFNIQTQEHGDRWLSGFANKVTQNWKAGDTVEIEVTENGKYLNYSPMLAKQPSKTWDKINELEKRLSKVETAVFKTAKEYEPEPELMPAEETLDDLPF